MQIPTESTPAEDLAWGVATLLSTTLVALLAVPALVARLARR